MPAPYPDVTCPYCSSLLRIWPTDMAPTFSCSMCSVVQGQMENTGGNLFRCYECGHDKCLDCVHRWRDDHNRCVVEQVLRTEQERSGVPQQQQHQHQALRVPIVLPFSSPLPTYSEANNLASKTNDEAIKSESPPPSYDDVLANS